MSPADDNSQELQRHIETLEQINEGLRQSFEELSQLYRLSETIASALTFSRVLTLLLDVVREVVEYDAAVLYLYEERTGTLRPNLEKGLSPDLRARTEAQRRDGLLQWALKQGRAVVVPDSGAGAWTTAVGEDEQQKSFLLVPIMARGKAVGLLNLIVFAGEGSFTQRDLSLLSILANQAGISLENARLYEAVRQDYVDVIHALAGAVDARDHYTREHSNRVSAYGVVIARQMGLDDAFIESVQFGGLLHDVGKIGIPDLILNKPGRLTDEEFTVMKSHATLGATLLRRVESLSPLVPLVLYHHERFDGRGYPEGLSGKKIPLGARILNVADSFETITSDRVYHKARSMQEGLEEIRRCSGGQFDPEVVAAFEAAFDEIGHVRGQGELMDARKQAFVAKLLTGVVALTALIGGIFDDTAGLLGLWVAVPALAGMGWRTPLAFLSAAGMGVVGLTLALVLHADHGQQMMAALCLGALAVSGWAGWLFLIAAQERGFAVRKAIDVLEEDLFKLREAKGVAEKSLAVHENRRKRYSRLQESATAMASSLELEKLIDLALSQAGQLLHGVPLNLTLFLLDGTGKEMMRRSLDLGGKALFPEDRPVGEDALNAWVMARGTSLVIKDLEKDFRFRGLDMQALKGRSFHLSPLLSTQGQVTGLVRAESIEREAMDQEDGRLLESLVVLASLAIENAKLYRETQDLAVTDGLTKLLLRRVLLEKLEQELVRAQEKDAPLSLVLLDIDHFKSVNDTYGHPAGDAVLREVAARVKRSVRDVDVCGRYGGEEFVVLLPQTPLDGALLVAERIREAVKAKAFELRGEERFITVSLGVAVFPQHSATGRALIESADEALYKSKENGRDRVSAAGEGA